MRTYYEVLGVSENASPTAIRQTYLRLLKIYHPDHNREPRAHSLTAELIEAYAVIGDPQKRAEYDNSRRPGATRNVNSAKEQKEPPSQALEEVVCYKCGVQNASLRIATMIWVASFLVITRRGGHGGVWCARCRAKQAATWSTITGVVGWWGFPWGPIYTIPALYENARGGKRDKGANANLLRIVGFQLFQKGHYSEARAALGSSLALEHNQQTIDFRNSIPVVPNGKTRSHGALLAVLTAAPSVLITVLMLVCLGLYMGRPSGYAARYHASTEKAPVKVNPPSDSGRRAVNRLADLLAGAVEAKATPTGSHQEGSTTVRDFQLDRSKYEPGTFDHISSQMEPLLSDASANHDGFASSAYFNATLMGSSITILNGFDDGTDISTAVRQVEGLAGDQRLHVWLFNSSFGNKYLELMTPLRNLVKNQSLGSSSTQRQAQLDALSTQIQALKSEIQSARGNGDAALEHTLVASHNRSVEEYNDLLKVAKRHHVLYERADLAFNKCLDAAILMSRFQQVNLTTGEKAIDASPEDN